MNGRDYLVVPVVALVEGVRHASGAENPELVLASSFGRYPETWNGRPVVVDHPVDGEGRGMSASDVEVLEQSYLGKLLNTKVEDGKLKVEAWLDLVAIDASESDKVIDMWTRLQGGEVVEVSVGAIVTVKSAEGEYDGKSYSGVWDTVIPDHLAFLGGEQIGACSVADGCGTYRIQSSGRIQLSEGVRMATKAAMKKVKSGDDVQVVTSMTGDDAGDGSEDESGCPCKTKNASSSGDCGCGSTRTAALEAAQGRERRLVEFASRALFDAETLDVDKRNILSRALQERFGSGSYAYIMAYSDTSVVFERYDGNAYKLYSLGYSCGEGNSVTLESGEPVEVVFQSKVVPVTKDGGDGKEKSMSALAAKSKKPPMDDTAEDEEDTADAKKKKAKSSAKDKTKNCSSGDEDDGDDMPESMAELMKQFKGTALGRELSEMVAFSADAKDKAKKVILAAKGGKHFTEDMLDSMDLKVLTSMADALTETEDDDSDDADEDDEESDEDAEELEESEDELASRKKGGKVVLKKGGHGGGDDRRRRNYAGRAGGARHAANGGVPEPPDVFEFDENDDLKGAA